MLGIGGERRLDVRLDLRRDVGDRHVGEGQLAALAVLRELRLDAGDHRQGRLDLVDRDDERVGLALRPDDRRVGDQLPGDVVGDVDEAADVRRRLLVVVVEVRDDRRDALRLGRLDLRLQRGRILAREQDDRARLLRDRGVHALHPLRRLPLVLPDRRLDARERPDALHVVRDRRDERDLARRRDQEDRLAAGLRLRVEGRAGRHEPRRRPVLGEVRLGAIGGGRDRGPGGHGTGRHDRRREGEKPLVHGVSL